MHTRGLSNCPAHALLSHALQMIPTEFVKSLYSQPNRVLHAINASVQQQKDLLNSDARGLVS